MKLNNSNNISVSADLSGYIARLEDQAAPGSLREIKRFVVVDGGLMSETDCTPQYRKAINADESNALAKPRQSAPRIRVHRATKLGNLIAKLGLIAASVGFLYGSFAYVTSPVNGSPIIASQSAPNNIVKAR